MSQSNRNKIAIIGVSLRLPGADNLDQLYHNLFNQQCFITEVPDQRWKDIPADKKPTKAWGAFVDDVDGFDAEFFNVSPREAQTMDPQQRMILELSHQAIENAAYAPSALKSTKTGVFMGVCHWDYAELYEKTGLDVDAYLPTGLAYSIIANRVSHHFDFTGPSLTNDSACSSALVAIIQAMQSITSGECRQALAGGINLLLSPNHFNAFAKNGMLSKTGQSSAFDQSANGYVRGEGGGVLLLKSLDDAIKDNDPIHAIIDGGGTNHGGHTNSLTVTNPKAQASLIEEVYQANGFSPESIGYIEAHGTGTPLGDPIEVLGLKMAFGAMAKHSDVSLSKNSCAVGSIKTNMGHLEGAAGMAGLLKVLVSIKNKTLLANANFKQANALLKLQDSPFYILKKSQKWLAPNNGPLRAGVSAFGFGGTNAHIAMQEIQTSKDTTELSEHSGACVVPISARNSAQLLKYAESLKSFIALHKDNIDLSSVAYTLQIARDAMQQRVVFRVQSLDQLQKGLSQLITDQADHMFYDDTAKAVHCEPKDLSNDVIETLLVNGETTAIAQAWVLGHDIDWQQMYQKQNMPDRIHVPSYVFARDKHWFPESVKHNRNHNYPVIQHSQQAYSIVLSSGHYLLKDHLIGGQSILPGVVVLELVRDIASEFLLKTTDISISKVVWLSPIIAKQTMLSFHVQVKEEKGAMTFEVVTSDDETAQKLCQGVINSASSVPLTALIDDVSKGNHVFTPDVLYQRLQSAGIVHGDAFRVVQKISIHDNTVTAFLKLNNHVTTDRIQWRNHPVLIDAAIQAVVALLPESTQAGIPFSLDNIAFLYPLGEQAKAIIHKRPESSANGQVSRYDVDILNQQNELSVVIRNLATKTLTLEPRNNKPNVHAYQINNVFSLVLAKPYWQRKKPIKSDQSPNSLVLFGLTEKHKYLPTLEKTHAQNCVIEPLFLPTRITDTKVLEQVLLLLVNKFKNLTKATKKTQLLLVMPSHLSTWLSPSISGLLKTINLESGLVTARVVSVQNYGSNDLMDDVLSQELNCVHHDAEVLYDKSAQRRVKVFKSIDLKPIQQIERKGVYWLTGGSGALARLFARYLVESGVEHVYLSGRSSLSEVKQRLDALSDIKQHITYLSVDITDREQVTLALEKVQQKGQLTGVIHAAGLIKDGLLINKIERDMSDVLAPKVNGVVNLDIATKHIRLDHFVVFSSIASTYGNLGQADYCAANGFMDGYMQWRNTAVKLGLRYGHSCAINWPLFAQGGMHVSDQVMKTMRKRMGVVPLPIDQALLAYDQATLNTAEQLAVAYGDEQVITDFFANHQIETNNNKHTALKVRTTEVVNKQKHHSVSQSPLSSVKTTAKKADHKPALQSLIIEQFAKVLVMDKNKIRTDVAFDTYGFDSIIAVELIEGLEKQVGELPKTLFFEHIDLNSVIAWLLEEKAQDIHQLFVNDEIETVSPAPETPVMKKNPDTQASQGDNNTQEPISRDSGLHQRDHRRTDDEIHDIAVIGVGGLYPGAKDLDEFWQNLKSGKHAFEPVPNNRWKHQDIYHHERDILGKSTIQTGSFLDDIDKFDPRYFNISQTEAELMSPEVRLMLQVAVQTFEDAGYSKEYIQQKMDGDVAVLVGTMSNHYNLYGFQNMLTRGSQASGSYTGTLPNMISYYYGLTGPSVFVDTMCSAAATCIDMAVRMLRTGQTKMVLAGGINLLLHPNNLVSSSQEHFTTKTAEVIRSFGVGADGTILGEGAGTVLLKPLKQAQRDGDNIQAVIRGTSLTNAGVRNGFTVPNPHMQSKAIRLALDDANINARTISYLEGHGSGTSLGDPIEIRALNKTFSEDTTDQSFCSIGSVKSNIAHLLAAAGIVGFTKVLLQMRHKQLVPSLHSKTINPAINFQQSPFVVQQELTSWQQPVLTIDGVQQKVPRRAGITSIGAGGMNSHIIVEEYPTPLVSSRLVVDKPHLLVFSAMHLEALKRLLNKYQQWLIQHQDVDFDRFAYTLQVGRTALNCRVVLLANNLDELLQQMTMFLQGDQVDNFFFIHNVLDAQMPDASITIETHVAQANTNDIARYWIAGSSVDWDQLWHVKPLRMSLPTYSFDQVRCWYEVYEDAPNIINPEAFKRKLHPLISKNTSDANGLRFYADINMSDLLDYQYKRSNSARMVSFVAMDVALALSQLVADKPESFVQLSALRVSPCALHEVDHVEYFLSVNDGDVLSMSIEAYWHKNDQQYSWFEATTVVTETAGHSARLKSLNNSITRLDNQAIEAIWQQASLSYTPYHQHINYCDIDENGNGEVHLNKVKSRQNYYHQRCTITVELLMVVQQLSQLLGHHFNCSDWSGFELLSVEGFSQNSQRLEACTTVRFAVKVQDQQSLTLAVYWLDANNKHLASCESIACGQLRRKIDVSTAEITQHNIGTDSLNQEIRDYVRKQMSDIVKFPESDIHLKTGFYLLGFDSISLTTLTDTINEAYGTQLTPALFYEVENLEQLIDYIVALGVKSRQQATHQTIDLTPSKKVSSLTTRAQFKIKQKPETSMTKGEGRPDKFAIIGMDGQFPAANNNQAFWQVLNKQTDALSDFPMERYGVDYQNLINAEDFCKRGGFLENVADFDAQFFNVSPTEAQLMDPQHRLFLQVAWNAMEMAGYKATDLPKNTGVFVGVSANEYQSLLKDHGVEVDAHTATGNSHAMLANRLSYFLGIHGPSEAIDTACSSSLVAINRAIEAIKNGNCNAAIAGGVNLNLSVDSFIGPHKAGMLSPQGKCKTFADDADGYVRGEGAGAVIIKPLAQAQADGDAILAVVIGSAVNHGGRANSLTAPNINAQSDLIVDAMGDINPHSITYVETHGTGTHLGDPVEIKALKKAYQQLADKHGHEAFAPNSCGLGSVKTNIGHLEAAAGVAGLIKLIMSSLKGSIPATLNCQTSNRHIELQSSPFYIQKQASVFDTGKRHRFALSSFGFGGANAHMIIENHHQSSDSAQVNNGSQWIVLSARSRLALQKRVEQLVRDISYLSGQQLAAVAYTLQVGREAMEYRMAFKSSSLQDLIRQLQAFLGGDQASVSQVRLFNGFPDLQDTEINNTETEISLDEQVSQWLVGQSINWHVHWQGVKPQRIHLSGYSFAQQKCWFDTSYSAVELVPGSDVDSNVEKMLQQVIDGTMELDQLADSVRK